MFRVIYSDKADGQRWSLHGRLAGPWVKALRSCWKYTHDRAPLTRTIFDLKEVTFIDQSGEALHAEMRSAGAELVAIGVSISTWSQPTTTKARVKAPEGKDK